MDTNWRLSLKHSLRLTRKCTRDAPHSRVCLTRGCHSAEARRRADIKNNILWLHLEQKLRAGNRISLFVSSAADCRARWPGVPDTHGVWGRRRPRLWNNSPASRLRDTPADDLLPRRAGGEQMNDLFHCFDLFSNWQFRVWKRAGR